MVLKSQDDKKALLERAKKFTKETSNELIVDLEEHRKELEAFIMRVLRIKQTTYTKLEAMVKAYNKKKPSEEHVDEVEFLDRIINEFHKKIFEK